MVLDKATAAAERRHLLQLGEERGHPGPAALVLYAAAAASELGPRAGAQTRRDRVPGTSIALEEHSEFCNRALGRARARV